MATLFRRFHSDTVAAIRHLLAARGLDHRDFDIDEDTHSGIGQLLGLSGGIVTLRRRSTGEIRVYAAGAGSAWYATIATDLDRGYFGAAPARPPRSRIRTSLIPALWF